MSERDVRADRVRREHLAEVSIARQWAYLAGVLAFGMLVMLAVLALLDAT
jgi:hypothetical protein